MAKKMTCKEFKETLEKSGMYFDIWGWEGILNQLSIYNKIQADQQAADGCMAAARDNKKRSDFFYETLTARGYYNH